MKTVKVSRNARTLRAILKQASTQDVILKTEDGHEFLLTEIDDFRDEIEATRRNKELMNLLDKRGREKATITMDELRARLGLAKRDRRNSASKKSHE